MNNFEREIKALDQELVNLQEYSLKNASILTTASYPVAITSDLVLSGGVPRGVDDVYIRITPRGDNTPLVANYIDVESLDDRNLYYQGGIQPDGTFLYIFYVTEGNSTDRAALEDGQSVTLNFTLNFVSTSELTIETWKEQH